MADWIYYIHGAGFFVAAANVWIAATKMIKSIYIDKNVSKSGFSHIEILK